MNFNAYLKDQSMFIWLSVIAWGGMLIFLHAFTVEKEPVIFISVIYFMSELIRLLLDFFRKKQFYHELLFHSENLDQKYLLPEMLYEPSFLEGKLFYEVLYTSHKSMCEKVAFHRRSYSEFREYIELWVHEIKLPVASMQLMCHNHKDLSEKYMEQLRRVDTYIENVLYYARSENAEKDYLIKEVSLKKAFTNTILKYRDAIQERDISLRTENLDKRVYTDGKWLEYMISQFLDNSIKYISSERKPEFYVYTKETNEQIELHFYDNGIGISPADLPNIFKKSFTGDNGRLHKKSTGFGLYIVNNLCEKLGHQVLAESRQGEYTEIVLLFGKNDYYFR